jgi:hypothetical protein
MSGPKLPPRLCAEWLRLPKRPSVPSGQLTLDDFIALEPIFLKPGGHERVEIVDITMLADSPWRVCGWYYGYPGCCVEAFAAEAERAFDPPGPLEFEQPPQHPVSGHNLCPACAAGPPAPLPPRPAARRPRLHRRRRAVFQPAVRLRRARGSGGAS